MRTCVACRQAFEREVLIRLVVDSAGQVLVDYLGKAPGRGAHLCYSADCISRLAKSKALGRAFGCQIQPFSAEEVTAWVLKGIEGRIADLLGLARRSRAVISGMDSLERSRSKLLLLVLSTDASAATADRCRGWARALECPLVEYGDREFLGRTQGVPERVALGVVDERVSEQLIREFGRRDRVLVAG